MLLEVSDFNHWRQLCRSLIAARLAPDQVRLAPLGATLGLFEPETPPPALGASSGLRVSREFLQLAEAVACHRDSLRWQLLYRLLWRLVHEQPQLLAIATDDDVHRAWMMNKQVARDCHKMKAFVRFRRVACDDRQQYIAWHRPDHDILARVAPFFARRFAGMHWTIMTPVSSAQWDGQQLTYGPGMPREAAPAGDELEDLWKTYYGATFNPARIKLDMMRKEMPVRHWSTLPETTEIDRLLEEAPERVARMVAYAEGSQRSAADYLPGTYLPGNGSTGDRSDWFALQQAAVGCRGCDLCQAATQTVFGQGAVPAAIMLVGEQPGDQEDLAGQPFVGPAGQLLDQALAESGLDRDRLYLTNAVKHFHFQSRGQQRLHKTPSSRHITACRPWLEAEVTIVRPRVVVCLGGTALHAVVGRHVRMGEVRGQTLPSTLGPPAVATWHPAAILRALPEQRQQKFVELTSDLGRAREMVQ